jgi:serine/threonine protein kinase
MVMSRLPESLEDLLAAGALPVAEGLRYAISVAEALRESHERGHVYGFLQPGGITIIEGRVRLVRCGPPAPSPYFSPEQIAGKDLDLRSDIFSLGAVMYEMLTGRKAFGATSEATLCGEIPDREYAPLESLPPALAHLIESCLEKKPERRIQRMEILLAELKLQAILSGGTCPSRPVPAIEREESKQGPIMPGQGMEPAEPTPSAAVSPPALVPPRTKTEVICPMCGSRDVHFSRSNGLLESALLRLGARIHRCHRCYHRFLQVAGFYFRKQGRPEIWIRSGPGGGNGGKR